MKGKIKTPHLAGFFNKIILWYNSDTMPNPSAKEIGRLRSLIEAGKIAGKSGINHVLPDQIYNEVMYGDEISRSAFNDGLNGSSGRHRRPQNRQA